MEGTDSGEIPPMVVCCKAFPFPEGIPREIAYGDNLHQKPLKNQKNDIVYEEDISSRRMCVHFGDDEFEEYIEPKPLTQEQMHRIIVEETLGKKPTILGEEADEFRESLQDDIKLAKKNGWTIEIPE